MAIHRDSPGIEPEPNDADPVEPRQRFARLVGSSVARRVALPKLALAVAIAGSVLITLGFVFSWAARSIVSYVDTRPEQQIPFAKIELVPEPDRWVKGGAALILEQVRTRSKLPENLPLQNLNLGTLATDFKGSPWIKRVLRIDRSLGRLTIHVEYRKPIAALVLKKKPPEKWAVEMIDAEGVPLPQAEIDWKSKDYPYSVVGIGEPLLVIWGADPNSVPNYGIPWEAFENGKPIGPDVLVAKAARLADFLRKQPLTTPKGNAAPKIGEIQLPGEPSGSFVIADLASNQIVWGKPPGDEKPGELSAEARWKLVLDRVDRSGPLKSEPNGYFYFADNCLKVYEPTQRPKKNLPNQ